MKIQEGFIKLFRSFTSWHLYMSQNVKAVFIHLLLIANYQDDESLRRGQCKITLRSLADSLGLTVQNIRTALSTLTKAQVITQAATQRYIIVTICNYAEYQENIKVNQHEKQHILQHNAQHNEQERTSPTPPKKEYKEAFEEEGEKDVPAQTPIKETLVFIQPTLSEVEEFITVGNYNVDAQRFFDYYSELGWKDKNGKAVSNWKTKVSQWSKREKKYENNKADITRTTYTGTSKQSANAEVLRSLFGKAE
ncbi:MAG: hypothetical protein HXN55_10065 [Prevotella nigrescens]|uniref:Helix-turn-helix domain-containing protein n=1 Tax=Prevotella nigrescens TaxID=28133 RepID=A0A9D6A8E4_9BACT|nr:hypothetical protein [Prevotella nigrescens]MBF1447708.1 hypothetical protein [Prevotella nigrescens]